MGDAPGYYFGGPGNASWHDGARLVETPVGQPCLICSDSIVDGDKGFIRVVFKSADILSTLDVVPVHVECEALGIVGHDFGVCSCTGYDTTARASALTLWERMRAAGVLYE